MLSLSKIKMLKNNVISWIQKRIILNKDVPPTATRAYIQLDKQSALFAPLSVDDVRPFSLEQEMSEHRTLI
jgi:hypothetical protein